MIAGQLTATITVSGEPFYQDILLTEKELHMSKNELAELIGDGDTRITISMALKDSDYGTGFEAFCAVQLTCEQDRDTIEIAQNLAAEVIEDFLPDLVERVRAQFTELVTKPKAPPKEEPRGRRR